MQKCCPKNDHPSELIGRYFDSVADEIQRVAKEGGITLVHCMAGIIPFVYLSHGLDADNYLLLAEYQIKEGHQCHQGNVETKAGGIQYHRVPVDDNFIGDDEHYGVGADNNHFLLEYQIKSVINVPKDVRNRKLVGIQYHRVPVDDFPSAPFHAYFD
ncbi:hypothetical protein JD844_002820 [Phrynosoma platyrhinos]|uniref:Uncharacterized protein n=1 Tax=Phrynosoma platyrhinos TaxID=52577 RepID=A0ABQ7TCC1_PHRPL|nr:hypothetical protein JD844_002820 [Phrynosoma platyrhinos]